MCAGHTEAWKQRMCECCNDLDSQLNSPQLSHLNQSVCIWSLAAPNLTCFLEDSLKNILSHWRRFKEDVIRSESAIPPQPSIGSAKHLQRASHLSCVICVASLLCGIHFKMCVSFVGLFCLCCGCSIVECPIGNVQRLQWLDLPCLASCSNNCWVTTQQRQVRVRSAKSSGKLSSSC